MAATTPTAPSSRGSVRCTRPRQRTRTGPAKVISLGSVRRVSTGEPSLTSLERKNYTPRELTSRDSVLVSPTAAPVVQRTVSGSRMEKRWVVRRSEPVKEVLLIEERVYTGAAQGTIGLRIQNRFNAEKYRGTRTEPETRTRGYERPPRIKKTHVLATALTVTKHWPLRVISGRRTGSQRSMERGLPGRRAKRRSRRPALCHLWC